MRKTDKAFYTLFGMKGILMEEDDLKARYSNGLLQEDINKWHRCLVMEDSTCEKYCTRITRNVAARLLQARYGPKCSRVGLLYTPAPMPLDGGDIVVRGKRPQDVFESLEPEDSEEWIHEVRSSLASGKDGCLTNLQMFDILTHNGWTFDMACLLISKIKPAVGIRKKNFVGMLEIKKEDFNRLAAFLNIPLS